jgi:hypothetical protein
MHKDLSELRKQIETGRSGGRRFTLQVNSVSADDNHFKVQLCTGTVMDVPASIVKEVISLGTVECPGGVRKGLASGEVDTSTDAGKVINQMAIEIERLACKLQILEERSRGSAGKPSVEERALSRLHELMLTLSSVPPVLVAPKLPVPPPAPSVHFLKFPVTGQADLDNYCTWSAPAGYYIVGGCFNVHGYGCRVESAIPNPAPHGPGLNDQISFKYDDPAGLLSPSKTFSGTIGFAVYIAEY